MMIATYKHAPVAYALDVGINLTDSGPETVLIEVNDAYSLGSPIRAHDGGPVARDVRRLAIFLWDTRNRNTTESLTQCPRWR